jgi:hypothetical protein
MMICGGFGGGLASGGSSWLLGWRREREREREREVAETRKRLVFWPIFYSIFIMLRP